MDKRQKVKTPKCPKSLADVIESTGDQIDRELAMLLRQHPLPWDISEVNGTMRINNVQISIWHLITMACVAKRYAQMIANSELSA